MAYTTKQHQAILACLRQQARPLSATALASALRQAGQSVGLATIYRQLEKLELAGAVHKVSTPEGAYYQYCGQDHDRRDCLLLKCEGCGRIVHLDCSQLQPLYRHLETEHQFYADHRRTLFTGLCGNCAKEKEGAYGGE